MNLKEALRAVEDGHFVTCSSFSGDESLHEYNGKMYYEDGAVVTEQFLEKQEFAKRATWRIFADKSIVDREKLAEMHRKASGYMLSTGTYNECIKGGNSMLRTAKLSVTESKEVVT